MPGVVVEGGTDRIGGGGPELEDHWGSAAAGISGAGFDDEA